LGSSAANTVEEPEILLNLSTLGEGKCILDVDAEMVNGTFDLGMSEEILDRAQVSSLFVDDRRLGPAQRTRPVVLRPQANARFPLIDEAGVLPGADVVSLIDPAWENEVVYRAAATFKPGQQTGSVAANISNCTEGAGPSSRTARPTPPGCVVGPARQPIAVIAASSFAGSGSSAAGAAISSSPQARHGHNTPAPPSAAPATRPHRRATPGRGRRAP
jgi:hypothetical protein